MVGVLWRALRRAGVTELIIYYLHNHAGTVIDVQNGLFFTLFYFIFLFLFLLFLLFLYPVTFSTFSPRLIFAASIPCPVSRLFTSWVGVLAGCTMWKKDYAGVVVVFPCIRICGTLCLFAVSHRRELWRCCMYA